MELEQLDADRNLPRRDQPHSDRHVRAEPEREGVRAVRAGLADPEHQRHHVHNQPG